MFDWLKEDRRSSESQLQGMNSVGVRLIRMEGKRKPIIKPRRSQLLAIKSHWVLQQREQWLLWRKVLRRWVGLDKVDAGDKNKGGWIPFSQENYDSRGLNTLMSKKNQKSCMHGKKGKIPNPHRQVIRKLIILEAHTFPFPCTSVGCGIG